MLAAQRFESFSKTQNIGLTTINNIKNSEVLNTVTNKLKEVTSDLEDRAKSLVQGVLPEGVTLSDIDSKVKESIRTVKDTFSTIQDMSKISQSDIEKAISEMLPDNPAIQNAFRTLTRQCRDNAMSNVPGFKPFSDNKNCGNSGDGKCKSGEVSGFLSKLTDGAIGTVARALQSLLKTLIALGNMGYSAGLCKLFATLANGMPPGVVQKGAAMLIATIGGKGNANGVMDISANMGTAVPAREIPGLVKRVSENFSVPENYNSATQSSLYLGMDAALGFIDPGHDVFETNSSSISSISSMGKQNEAFASTANSYIRDTDLTDFNTPVTKSGWDKAVAYIGDKVSNPFASI